MKEVNAMMLDIKPLHENYRSCVEDVVASVVSWWSREHELMYAGAWNFKYSRWNPVMSNTFGRRLNEGEDESWTYLASFHGVALSFQDNLYSPSDALDLIGSELRKKRPVMTYVNDFWCPWRKDYQTEHQIQPCLVIGFDTSGTNLICIDPFSTYEVLVFPVEQFVLAYKGCVTFIKFQQVETITNIKNIVGISPLKLFDSEGGKNRFDDMRVFAGDIDKTLDLNMEVQGGTASAPKSELLNIVKYITRRRKQFSVLLKYAEERYGGFFAGYSVKMDSVWQKWNIITNLFLKMYYMQDWYESRKNLADKIWKVADFEESIAKALLSDLGLRK